MLNLSNVKGLSRFADSNPYEEAAKSANEILNITGYETRTEDVEQLSFEEIVENTNALHQKVMAIQARKVEIDVLIDEYKKIIEQLIPLGNINVDIQDFFNLEFVKFRFGKLPRAGYIKIQTYLSDMDALFIESSSDGEYVWGIYFAPSSRAKMIDSVFSSLYFERIRISDKASGTPGAAIEQINSIIARLIEEKNGIDGEIAQLMSADGSICSTAKYYYSVFEVRKYATHTDESFYIMGWMESGETEELVKRVEKDMYIVAITEEPGIVPQTKPPTLMRNPKIFRPFESFVKMYGLPSYNEIDPTIFLAITYILMFGAMFGDMGHGLVLVLGGLLYGWRRGSDMAKMLITAGISSMFFGYLYGSVFGIESFISHYLIHPMANGGNMNLLLLISVGLGVALIIFVMVLNVINGVKAKDAGRVLFDHNGIAGIVFYISVVCAVMSGFAGVSIMSPAFITLCTKLPIILIFFKEPLTGRLSRKRKHKQGKAGEFVLEKFFEVFEVMLSFVTNTISFVRVGAFALNHAGMMMVVMSFYETLGGAGSVLVFIFGNILVIALEGLIVGIQVLRLEYYELFSRFFTGDGKQFENISQKFSNKN